MVDPNPNSDVKALTKEDYVEVEALDKRYLKEECDTIHEVVESRCNKHSPLRDDLIFQIASERLQERYSRSRSVLECWQYWYHKGMHISQKAKNWPSNAHEFNEILMVSSGKAIIPQAPKPGQDSALWTQEQKECLCKVLKKHYKVQFGKSKEVFWQIIGEAMEKAGYIEHYSLYRTYWDKSGRAEFNYDETDHYEHDFNATKTKPTTNQGISRPLESRHRGREQGGRRARRPSNLDPPLEDSPLEPIKDRKRSNADRYQEDRPGKRRASSPEMKTRKANAPQPIDEVLHHHYSRSHVKDNTAKVASEFSMNLFIATTGDIGHYGSDAKRRPSMESPPKATKPLAPPARQNTPKESPTMRASAARKSSAPSLNLSKPLTMKPRKSSLNVAVQGAASEPPPNDSDMATKPFEFRSSMQRNFHSADEHDQRTEPVWNTSDMVPKRQQKTERESSIDRTAPVQFHFSPTESNFEEETGQGLVRGKKRPTEVMSPAVPVSTQALKPAIFQTRRDAETAPTQSKIKPAILSINTNTTNRTSVQHHLSRKNSSMNHVDGPSNLDGNADYSDDDNAIFIKDTKSTTRGEDTGSKKLTIRPSKLVRALSQHSTRPSQTSSATLSLDNDYSSTSDQPIQYAQSSSIIGPAVPQALAILAPTATTTPTNLSSTSSEEATSISTDEKDNDDDKSTKSDEEMVDALALPTVEPVVHQASATQTTPIPAASQTPSVIEDGKFTTSDDEMEDTPDTAQRSASDEQDIEIEKALKIDMEVTTLEISNAQKKLHEIKEGKAATKKKIAHVEQEIVRLDAERDKLAAEKDRLAAEREKLKQENADDERKAITIEQRLKDLENYKDSLINCIESKEILTNMRE